MFRTVLAVTAILGVTTVVLAQTDPVATRKQQMGTIAGQAWSAFPKMVKGVDPYDQAKVDAGFVTMAGAASKLAPLFPKGTEGATTPNSNYVASPKIWENKADFDARLAKFEKDIGTAKTQATSLDGLKGALGLLNDNCNSCHDLYRPRK